MSAETDLREALGEVIGLIDDGEPILARRRALAALASTARPPCRNCFGRGEAWHGDLIGYVMCPCNYPSRVEIGGETMGDEMSVTFPCQRCFGRVEDGTCTCDEECL